jgi:hypothetical protein
MTQYSVDFKLKIVKMILKESILNLWSGKKETP